jgi:hypothetical protein
MGLDVSLNSKQINISPVGSTGRAGAAAPLAGTVPVQGQNNGSPFSNPLQPIDGQEGAALQAAQAIMEMMNMMMEKIKELMGGGALAGQNAVGASGDAGGGSPVSAAGGGCSGKSCGGSSGGSPESLASSGSGSCSGKSCSSGSGSCSGNTCSGGTCSSPGSADGANGSGRTTSSSFGNVTEVNTPDANAALKRSIERIAQDPEGAKLLQRALEKGLKTISVAKYDNPNLQGLYEGDKNRITVKDPNNIDTLVHELVHAASPEDGTAKEEEGLAKRIGSRVASRLTGSRPVSESSIQRDLRSFYTGLRSNNGSTQKIQRILNA